MALFLDFNSQSIPVHARVLFPSWDWKVQKFEDADYAAQFYVLAVKDDKARIKSRHQDYPFGPAKSPIRVTVDNLDVVRRHFYRWIAKTTKDAGIADPVFVPIPNRNGLIGNAAFKSTMLAIGAAAAFGDGASSFTGLRFREFVPKEAGHRQHVSKLAENMVVAGQLPPGTIVLVDDVYTLGQHLTAACRVLPRAASLGIVAGRTVKAHEEAMRKASVFNHYLD